MILSLQPYIVNHLKEMQAFDCFKVALQVLSFCRWWQIIGLFFIPIISSYLNIYINKRLSNVISESRDVASFLIVKGIYDYIVFIAQQKCVYKMSRVMNDQLILRLEMANIHCGVPIPGVNQKQYKDLREDRSKLRDFLFIVPFMWTSIITFVISIANIKTHEIYPIRLYFTLMCIALLGLMTYLTDASLYETTKPNNKKITKFDDDRLVKLKMSIGCVIDTQFEQDKREKQEKQQNTQKCIICFINLVVTLISLSAGQNLQIHYFGSITWMIGCLSDNLKSLGYKDYVREFIALCYALEFYKYKSYNHVHADNVRTVTIKNGTFGYCDGDLTKNPSTVTKIFRLTIKFLAGWMYYLEAPNGIGKSTILRMFMYNLFSGNIWFGRINRKNLSFETVNSCVICISQASEYTPKFSKGELESFYGRDEWLEERLGIKQLYEKDFVEMSGGQKKRMLLYISLTSDAWIVLWDETLSELSVEETPDVPEGGGWLNRIIRTLVTWPGRDSKIIILVGHGLLDLIPNAKKVIKLKMEHDGERTVLIKRK